MRTYSHTQFGYLVILLVGTPAVVLLAIMLAAGINWPMLGVLVVLAAVLLLFPSLTVRVDDGAILVRFGFGPIARTIPLADVRSAKPVRNAWYYGWGVRWIPKGWMFNISGLGAAELEFANGRRFRIGTDEPARLADAINARIKASLPPSACPV